MRQTLFLMLFILVAACQIDRIAPEADSVPPPSSIQTSQSPYTDELGFFHAICIKTLGDESRIASTAKTNGFIAAKDIDLFVAKLAHVKKSTLKIPGGGAYISETQQVQKRQVTPDKRPIILVNEQQFAKSKRIKSSCDLYASFNDGLKACTSLGYMLNRPPQKNRQLKGNKVHLLEWNGSAGKTPMTIGCEVFSENSEEAFKGTRLSAQFLYQ